MCCVQAPLSRVWDKATRAFRLKNENTRTSSLLPIFQLFGLYGNAKNASKIVRQLLHKPYNAKKNNSVAEEPSSSFPGKGPEP